MPWSWLLLTYIFGVISKKCDFFSLGGRGGGGRRLFEASIGHGRYPKACLHERHVASPRIVPHSSKISSCLFLFLCSEIHYMILEEVSNKQFSFPRIFEVCYDSSYFRASKNHKK